MTLKDKVLLSIIQNGNEYISGEELAHKLNVSRNAVWKAVKQLEQEGFAVEAVRNRGYRIVSEENKLHEAFIQRYLKTEKYGQNLIILDETDSTNNYAKKLAQEGTPHGTVVAADCQNAGKGRLGRTFVSPKGTGLYVSLVLTENISISSAQLITACAAVAAAEAVEELCSCDIKIKWVNDLFLNDKKLCGILTEASMSFESNQLDYVIIGIGINVNSLNGKIPEELNEIVTSIEDETHEKISRNQLCAVLLEKLEKRLNELDSKAFLDEYRKRSMIIGRMVTVEDRNGSHIGKAVAIADDAGLTIEYENGEIKTINSGEARIYK